MNQYILLVTIIGFAAIGMAWMPAISKRTGISYAIIYVFAGAVLYGLFGKHLPNPVPQNNETLALHLTELVVIISLMGTGIKIDRAFSFRKWASPLKLIFIAMFLCVGLAALTGYTLLNFDLASAVLLGGVLAPTDPVLASDVQVGPPNTGVKSETRFTLTTEAGLNDGMAFPFIWLAILLCSLAKGNEVSFSNWLSYDVLYKIAVGLILGFVLGKVMGFAVFRLPERYPSLKIQDGLLAIALTLFVYGITEMVHGYGFIAVFISAITLRHFEKGHDLHHELHSVTDQVERLLVAVVLLLFGGSLVSGILSSLSWPMVGFALMFLLIIRPVTAYVSLSQSGVHQHERLAISFFGIRGMGSLFYLSFAFQENEFIKRKELWSLVAFTILLSIVVHGLTASPVMKHLGRTMPKEDIPQ